MGFIDAFNNGILFKMRLMFYSILIFLSFFIFVGVSVMRGKVKNDRCPLYGTAKLPIYYFSDGDSSNCDYPVAIAVLFQLIFLTFRVISLVLVLVNKLSDSSFLFSDLFQFLYVLIDVLAFFFTFVGACILAAGSAEVLSHTYPFPWLEATKVALAGAWISTFLWLIIGAVGIIVLWNTGKVPIIGGKKQESTAPPPEQHQTDFYDPAAVKFAV